MKKILRKMMIPMVYIILISIVIIGNAYVLFKTDKIEHIEFPKLMRSDYYITLDESGLSEDKLNIVIYDKQTPSKFSFVENIAGINFQTEEMSITVNRPEKINSTTINYEGNKISVIDYILQVPNTNISMYDADIVIEFVDSSVFRARYGDIVFNDFSESNENHIHLTQKMPLINGDNLIPEIMGYSVTLEVYEPLTLLSFDIGVSHYGINKEQVVCISSDEKVNDIQLNEKIVSDPNYELPDLYLDKGTYTLYIPFTKTEKNPPCLWQLGGELTYSLTNGNILKYQITSMTNFNLNITDFNIVKGVLEYE